MSSVAGQLARQEARRRDGTGSNSNAVPFQQQDFQQLRSACLRDGVLFCDPAFPADWSSLGYNQLGRYSSKTTGLEWKRPTELCSNPQFIIGGAKRTDICQGALGDCWLLAAIASLTLDPQILARVVPSGQGFQQDYAGIFHFQLWQYGDWVDVVVDDRLPTRDGKLLFVHSAEGSEFWSALLEKAYAKVNSSYEALSGGSTLEGFEDFTGGIAETYDLKDPPPHLFPLMRKALRLGSLLGCSIDISSSYETEAITGQKLVKGHAYSITAAQEVRRLLRIRNPWGQVEWTGAWSDGSREWDAVRPEEKSKLEHSADDGEFWMSFSDFLRQFSRLEMCNLTPDTLSSDEVGRWSYSQFEGAWRVGSTAGGCRNYPATFCSNPQFVIRLQDVDDEPHDGEDGCTLLVGLMQKDGRRERRFGRDLNTIGFAIYQQYRGRRNVHLGPDVLLRSAAVARSRTFINLREVCDRFKLPPGEYVIIPSTFEPHRKGSFVLRVFTEKQADSSWDWRKAFWSHSVFSAFQPLTEVHTGMIWSKVVDNVPDRVLAELQANGRLAVSMLTAWSRAGLSADWTLTGAQRDGSDKLGLVEFHALWTKIQKYLVRLLHITGTGGYLCGSAGFQVNSTVIQEIVSRYADDQCAIDFDCFVGCLIRLETLFKMFRTLDKKNQGKIELDIQQVKPQNYCNLNIFSCFIQM
uniref:Calpain 8 n=1 Tax=Myripristis murdjan TaxID=586833 RepID=A0A667WI99_9TELE